jgi:uncharacterized repeat protein (TIGR03837 family)
MPTMLLDIFCRVIDNFGDIGVCWRLSTDLAARGHNVRLWVDDATALQWMAPGALEGRWPGVAVNAWKSSCEPQVLANLKCADVWLETFGCEIPLPFVAHFAQRIEGAAIDSDQYRTCQIPVWINLEYLSAEPYVERSHGLPSPIMHGPAKGWSKFFFYPGFSAKTGGLLREPNLKDGAQPCDTAQRAAYFQQQGIPWQGERVVSLFCYEPVLLKVLLDELATSNEKVHLLVTQGRASNATQAVLGMQTQVGRLQISYLPWLTQVNYDSLLTCCDVNFVRGEDSVLRAVWAGQPFVWHIYPQEDLAHSAKLEAFLEQMQFGAVVRTLHRAWNGLPDAPRDSGALACLEAPAIDEWHNEVLAARQRLFKMDDLTTCLLEFAQKKR